MTHVRELRFSLYFLKSINQKPRALHVFPITGCGQAWAKDSKGTILRRGQKPPDSVACSAMSPMPWAWETLRTKVDSEGITEMGTVSWVTVWPRHWGGQKGLGREVPEALVGSRGLSRHEQGFRAASYGLHAPGSASHQRRCSKSRTVSRKHWREVLPWSTCENAESECGNLDKAQKSAFLTTFQIILT